MPEDEEKSDRQWVVRDVPQRTRRLVKRYAVDHDLTVGSALEALVDEALRKAGRFQEVDVLPNEMTYLWDNPQDPRRPILTNDPVRRSEAAGFIQALVTLLYRERFEDKPEVIADARRFLYFWLLRWNKLAFESGPVKEVLGEGLEGLNQPGLLPAQNTSERDGDEEEE